MENQQEYFMAMGDKERREYFEEYAAEIYKGKYSRPLSEEEVVQAKDKLSDGYIKLSDLVAAFDEVKALHKEKVKPFKQLINLLAVEIRTRQTFTEGTIYSLINVNNGQMESYNEHGQFLHSRKLRPDEKPATLFQIGQAANDK